MKKVARSGRVVGRGGIISDVVVEDMPNSGINYRRVRVLTWNGVRNAGELRRSHFNPFSTLLVANNKVVLVYRGSADPGSCHANDGKHNHCHLHHSTHEQADDPLVPLSKLSKI